MWLILIIVVLTCLALLIFLRKRNEGFGEFKDSQMAFANKQYTYFHDTANQGIFTNPGLNKSLFNSAVSHPDPDSLDRDYASYLHEDPENAYSENDKKFCKTAKHPKDFPPRVKNSSIGCGWYFVKDPTTPSVGILGTRDAPIFNDNLPPNGEWIYDIGVASMKEDIKMCKRVKSCALMDLDGIKGVCGFCERLGYAIPIKSDGSEKYPDSTEGSCGEQTLNTRTDCLKPTSPVIITDEGVSCGSYGRASSDNSVRLYTNSECNSLGGNYYADGECLKKMGGSFSWDCRSLNAPSSVMDNTNTDEIKNICATNSSGKVSRECLMSLASGIGFGKSGAIMRLLNSTNSPNQLDQQAITLLNGSGISVPNAVLGGGDIDTHSAGTIYNQIYNAISSGQTESVKQAARYLAVGGIDFDPCSAGSTSTACFQQEFRKAGCQPAGSAYPNDNTVGQYGTLDQASTTFKTLFSQMKSTDVTTQDSAMKNCLGTSYYREPPPKDPPPRPVGPKDLGCWGDDGHLIPGYIGNVGDKNTPEKRRDECIRMAKEYGDKAIANNEVPADWKPYNMIGVRWNQCSVGYTTDNYKRFGPGKVVPNVWGNTCDRIGHTSQVYEIGTAPPSSGYCKGLGRPSAEPGQQQGRMRVYTKEECDQLNGNHYEDGQCLVKTGGSYSWVCRYLNPGLENTQSDPW